MIYWGEFFPVFVLVNNRKSMKAPSELAVLYQEMTTRTLAKWNNAPGCGEVWRYRAQRLPEPWRAFFLHRQHQCFGSVSATRKLVMANYNWPQVQPLT